MNSFFRRQSLLLIPILVLIVWTVPVPAQTGAFTYQGRLADNAPQGSSYLLKFELYDASTDGTLIETLTDVPATVANGVFTVELNFAAANTFDGGERFLQISVRRNASENYVTLAPRQKLTSAPYAVRALTATNALQIDGTPASQFVREGDTRLTDARQPLAGSGDYIRNQSVAPQISTNFNISGTGGANIFNAATQFNIGGNRILSTPGLTNTFAGINSGAVSSGLINSFFGFGAGSNNTTGESNSFFGADSGLLNTTGESNVGAGRGAGYTNTAGSFNVFIGRDAGENNLTGSNNIFLGSKAKPTLGDLSFATAIGAGATVSTSNTIVLGRSDGTDTVQIPGALNISGAFAANAFNAATQYNIGGSRVLFTTPFGGRTFAGINAGRDNTGGSYISFFGESAGMSNTDGTHNAFFGSYSGSKNTTGGSNSFFGADAGFSNLAGAYNTFVGFRAGWANTSSENTFVGTDAGWATTTGSKNVFVGRGTGATNTVGSDNTFIGYNAQPTVNNLSFAAAIGSNATVSTSDTIVLGRSGGQDTVQVPGTLNAANINAGTQFSLNSLRILTAGNNNIFLGFNTGPINTSGQENSFFGNSAGSQNGSGIMNAFFGFKSGTNNTNGSDNSFFGKDAGVNNTTGNRNTFVGTITGFTSTTGNDNTALGFNANVANNLSFATAIGSNATVSTSNTIVLGRSGGQDAVQIPGRVQVGGGDVYVDNPGAGVIMRSPNGNCFRLTVANNGSLATALVACPQ